MAQTDSRYLGKITAGRREKGLPHRLCVLALSGANAPALPKGEPLAVHANFIFLPRPLPLGEVDLRSKDGEGEDAKAKTATIKKLPIF